MTYAFYNFLWKLIDYFLINYLNLELKKEKKLNQGLMKDLVNVI